VAHSFHKPEPGPPLPGYGYGLGAWGPLVTVVVVARLAAHCHCNFCCKALRFNLKHASGTLERCQVDALTARLLDCQLPQFRSQCQSAARSGSQDLTSGDGTDLLQDAKMSWGNSDTYIYLW